MALAVGGFVGCWAGPFVCDDEDGVYFSRDILLQVESFENKLLSILVISWRVELVLYTA